MGQWQMLTCPTESLLQLALCWQHPQPPMSNVDAALDSQARAAGGQTAGKQHVSVRAA